MQPPRFGSARRFLWHVWFCILLAAHQSRSRADPVAVLTHHNDLSRTGANLRETLLTTRNVNRRQFGLLAVRWVDDEIYAQPLIMTNVVISGKGRHNLVLAATVNDSVYAFDADDPQVEQPYWHVNFLSAGAVPPRNTDMVGACDGHYTDFSGNIGIIGTPVIDPQSQTLYVVARTKEQGSRFVQRLHALNPRDGRERRPGPVTIEAECAGRADDGANGIVRFDPLRENQRPGLALTQGTVYIGWASHCDWPPYHGWLLGYDAQTLRRTVVYNSTPDGDEGGIWMSGEAPAIDSEGCLYITIGNGSVGSVTDPRATINRGESLVKLQRVDNRLSQYQFDRARAQFTLPEKAHSPNKAPLGMPGGFLSLSADTNRAGTGILWASHPLSGDANHEVRPGILCAYDAEDVSHELWNSEQAGSRDRVGTFSKFCPPTVANGKVYLAAFSRKLCIYGLLAK